MPYVEIYTTSKLFLTFFSMDSLKDKSVSRCIGISFSHLALMFQNITIGNFQAYAILVYYFVFGDPHTF